jgi:iron complex transport system substrate-binding protein
VIQDADLQNIEEQPTVYYEKGGTLEDFGTTNSSMSGWGMVIAYAGGDNIADDALSEDQMKGMGATLDPEYILEADPDYVVLSGSNDLGLTTDETILETADFSIIDREGWDNITAVENGDVYEVMHELSRTPISFYAVQELAKVFYPETFEDLDPDANLAEYFENYTLLGDDSSIWFMQISD